MLSPVAARAASGRFSSCGNEWGQLHTTSSSGRAPAPHASPPPACDDEQPCTSNGNGGAVTGAAEAGSGSKDGGPSPRYVYICLVGYCLSFVVFGSQVSILGPTLGTLARRLDVSEPDLSPLFTALGVSCIVSGTPSGWVVDRVPVHHVLIGSLLIEVGGWAGFCSQWLRGGCGAREVGARAGVGRWGVIPAEQ